LGDRNEQDHHDHEHDHHDHEHEEHKHHDHVHDRSVSSVAIVESGEMNGEKVNDWIGNLLNTQGADIFRTKGILNIAGDDHRCVFQGVHMLFDAVRDRPWKPNEERQNQLVFIGRNLDAAQLKADFLSCLEH